MAGAGPPVWTYFFAVPLVIAGTGWFFSTMQPGRKVKFYKDVSGRRVRDYDRERAYARQTRP
jgi:hypothetical protein